ncbi:MAG: hypothetical protein HYY01_14615 [Chloroflexi bacterium]|nr:hypothetical protein [Chloroflexota bacterium]
MAVAHLRRSAAAVVAVAVLAVSVAGCGAATPTSTPTLPPTPTGVPVAPRYRIDVAVDGALFSLGTRDLQRLPQRSLSGGPGKGPTLLSVLNEAGVKDFSTVRVTGSSPEGKPGAQTSLARGEVVETVLLVLTEQGTAGLAGPTIPRERWIASVTRLDVQGSAATPATEYAIEVIVRGEKVAFVPLSQLKGLEAKTVGEQQGPTLLDALKLAGVQDFVKLTVSGFSPGRRGPAQLVLARAEVNDQVILDFTNKGTVKLTGPDIPNDKWVLDVARLTVD